MDGRIAGPTTTALQNVLRTRPPFTHDAVCLLLSRGADLNAECGRHGSRPDLTSALDLAARHNDVEALKMLVGAGAKTLSVARDGRDKALGVTVD